MNWTVTQYLDWKLSEIQTMVLEKKPSADIIHELQTTCPQCIRPQRGAYGKHW